MNNMRIVIDMQGAQTQSRFRGIGRYTIEFAKAVIRNCGNHEVVLALSGLHKETVEVIRDEFNQLINQKNICTWYTPIEKNNLNYVNNQSGVAELIREAFLASLKPDVVHISSLFEGDDAISSIGLLDKTTHISVILYDLIPLLNPNQYLEPNPQFKRHYMQKIEYLRQSSLILAISEFSKEEAVGVLGIPEEKIISISTAVSSEFKCRVLCDEVVSDLKSKFGITGLFLLYTGGMDERKNLNRLIEAYARLPIEVRSHYQLVLAGRISQDELSRLKNFANDCCLHNDEICFTNYISDDDLISLYNLCQIFVFPSWHEGFGLPALEAMSCGAPVIGANNTSLPEVIGMHEALFDPFDVKDISEKIRLVLTDDDFRRKLRDHGVSHAQKFSWDKVAKHAIAGWEMLEEKCPSDLCLKKINLNKDFIYKNVIDQLAQKCVASTDFDLMQIACCLALNEESSGIRGQHQ